MKQRLLLSVLSPLALGVLVLAGCGSSSQELDDARAETASLSNKLQQAETRVSELERTVQTALTNFTLARNDLTSLSNRFLKVKAELANAQGRWSIAEVTANQRAARIAELEGQSQETGRLITELRQQNADVATRLAQANGDILDADARRQAAVNARELLKARIIELEQLMNNADWLRSQYRRVKSAPSAPPPTLLDTSTPAVEQSPTPTLGEVEVPAAFVPPRFRALTEQPGRIDLSSKTLLEMQSDGTVRVVGRSTDRLTP